MPVLVGGVLGSVGSEVGVGSLVGSGSSVVGGGAGVLVPVSGGCGGGAGGRCGASGSERGCSCVVVPGASADSEPAVVVRGFSDDEDAGGGGCGGRGPDEVLDSTAEVGCSVMSGPASSGRCEVATIAAVVAKTVATPTPVAASTSRRLGRESGSSWSIAVLADSGGRSNTVATGKTGMIRRSAGCGRAHPAHPAVRRWCAAAAGGQA
ncbi:hypothetical protein GCM10027174_34550 [Salinifilum aidingensis]